MSSLLVSKRRGKALIHPQRINPGYWFVAPGVLYFAVMAVFPALYVFYLSLHTSPRGRTDPLTYVGLQNYTDMFATRRFEPAVTHTIYFAVGSAVFHLLLGLMLALLLNSSLNKTYLNICRGLLLMPWAVSPVVVAMVSRLLAHPQISPIGIVLNDINPHWTWQPLASMRTALPAVTAINVWHFTPFFMLMLLAGLQAIDPTIYEVAMIDGANLLQRIWFITLPQVRRLLLTLGLFDVVTTAVYFDLIWITTRGGPVNSTETLTTLAYRTAFMSFNFGSAASIGVMLFAVSITLSIIVVFLMERE
jgi:multiple sugar transport system permease protein